jgi:diguanylate cyclase
MQQFLQMHLIKRSLPAWTSLMALGLGFIAAYVISSLSQSPHIADHSAAGGVSLFTLISVSLLIIAFLLAVSGAIFYAPRFIPALRKPASNESAQNKVLAQTGALLNLELGKVLGIIRARMGSDESYALSLANAQARLAELPTPEQVRVIVGLLVAENHRMRLDSANMAKQLDASRLQIEGLRLRLERAQEVGLQDALTAVGNRRCFDVALLQAIKIAEDSHAPLSIIMGDLDRFKNINDQYGHPVGDEVLKFFTQLMVASVRDGDTVARFGGEEFAIILPQCKAHEASAIAERIRHRLSAKSLTIRRTSQDIGLVTASFGVAQLLPGEHAENVIARADGALYAAKNSGRNRVALA